MIKIKTANAIRTSSEIKSYRSLKHAVAAPLGSIDCGRIKMGQAKRMEKRITNSGSRQERNLG